MYDTDAPDHVCHIDCQLIIREDGGRSHIRYAAAPNTAAGRYQYDRNREILNMGPGARKAMRATGQDDTRTNREWNYARRLFKNAVASQPVLGMTKADALYRDEVNAVFGPNRRPYVKRSIRSRARLARTVNQPVQQMLMSEAWRHSRPAYLPQSEHDPNL